MNYQGMYSQAPKKLSAAPWDEYHDGREYRTIGRTVSSQGLAASATDEMSEETYAHPPTPTAPRRLPC